MLDIKKILVSMTEAYLAHRASYLVMWVLWGMAQRMPGSVGCMVCLQWIE